MESVGLHARFIPETARRIADPLFTEGLRLDAHNLGQFVEKRERFLQEVLQGLDCHSRAALALIYMGKDRLESPIDLQRTEEQALDRLGSDLGGCVAALESLNGSLVLHSHVGGDSFWRFKHPTIGDAYAAILIQSPELLGIFVQGAAPDRLVQQVTCGDVGIEKAVIIPKSLFPLMLMRLREFPMINRYKSVALAAWGANSAVQRFLARRCSKEFLSLYLDENPDLLDKVSEPGLYLYAVSEVNLAVRLQEFKLLPEDKRKKFIETISEYAIQGDDLVALEDVGIRSVFVGCEFKSLLQSVRTRLLPRLDEVRRDWQFNHDSDERPEDHMQQLLDGFETLRKHFRGDPNAATTIEREIRLANEWIAEATPEEQEKEPRTLGNFETPDKPRGSRSIFDDVDA